MSAEIGERVGTQRDQSHRARICLTEIAGFNARLLAAIQAGRLDAAQLGCDPRIVEALHRCQAPKHLSNACCWFLTATPMAWKQAVDQAAEWDGPIPLDAWTLCLSDWVRSVQRTQLCYPLWVQRWIGMSRQCLLRIDRADPYAVAEGLATRGVHLIRPDNFAWWQAVIRRADAGRVTRIGFPDATWMCSNQEAGRDAGHGIRPC